MKGEEPKPNVPSRKEPQIPYGEKGEKVEWRVGLRGEEKKKGKKKDKEKRGRGRKKEREQRKETIA